MNESGLQELEKVKVPRLHFNTDRETTYIILIKLSHSWFPMIVEHKDSFNHLEMLSEALKHHGSCEG